jgi:hypothetical protein
MKKVIRLNESDLTNIVKRVINEDNSNYFRRRIHNIEKILDEIISEITNDEFHFEDYDDYKSEVIWSTLSTMEYDEGRDLPKEYIEDYFSFMERPEFIEKIKRGYSMFKKNRK